MIDRFTQIYEVTDSLKVLIEDKDKGQTVLHEGVNKRLRIITNEVDDMRKQLDGQIVLVRRIEAVEAKA